MVGVWLRPTVRDTIVAHAQRERPRECCGVLVGQSDEILEAMPTSNLSEDPNRFLIDPQGHLDALRSARARGLEVVGFYHSHPHSDARASATDVAEITYPGYLYVIVGLLVDPPEIRVFRASNGDLLELELTSTF